ncbi:MAG: hypothetical protein HPAVJP_5660 [Candidatus Hepatoplasma vulgare]|nr:MAG: hypothetical protein HPAVJP_5660 [Candidatus Hepatoplasma sp.]
MNTKKGNLDQVIFASILTNQVIPTDAAREGGENQEIINDNNFTLINQANENINKNISNISINTNNIGNLSSLKTNMKSNLVDAINELKDEIDLITGGNGTTPYPIGTIVIAPTAPEIGNWEDLGEILEGQAIIGGSSSDGSIIAHTHNIEYNGSAEGISNKFWDESADDMSGNYSRGASDNGDGNFYADIASKLKITTTGNDKNRAYGIGLGLGLHLWKRIS